MDQDRLTVFEKLLEDRLHALDRKADSAIGTLTERRVLPSDAVDVASEESARELTLRMHEHDRRITRAIQSALQRVRSGDYGVCASCGDDISERRLLARPMAMQCIDCQTEAETHRRPAF